MNRKAENGIISILLLILGIVAAYGSLAYFLINTNLIEEMGYVFHVKLIYFLISLLFGALVILWVIVLNRNKNRGKK